MNYYKGQQIKANVENRKIKPILFCFKYILPVIIVAVFCVILFNTMKSNSLKSEDVIAQLKANGYNDAHIKTTFIGSEYIYLFEDENKEHISLSYIDKEKKEGIKNIMLYSHTSETDYVALFDAVIPLFNDKHKVGDGLKIYENIKDWLFEDGVTNKYSKNNITYSKANYRNFNILVITIK